MHACKAVRPPSLLKQVDWSEPASERMVRVGAVAARYSGRWPLARRRTLSVAATKLRKGGRSRACVRVVRANFIYERGGRWWDREGYTLHLKGLAQDRALGLGLALLWERLHVAWVDSFDCTCVFNFVVLHFVRNPRLPTILGSSHFLAMRLRVSMTNKALAHSSDRDYRHSCGGGPAVYVYSMSC